MIIKIQENKSIFLLLGKIILMLMFALACRQPPLYASNQNTYFLFGLAKAGVGHLNLDWFANTIDPLPVFSSLVYYTIRFLGDNAFYFYKIILTALYAYCIVELGALVFKFRNMGFRYLSLYFLLAALYSGLLDRLLFNLPGMWWSLTSIYRPYGILTWGAAEQYIHGPILQPSSFGVFILLSILAFHREKLFFAIVLLCTSVIFHTTYLLSAAVLTCTYMGITIVRDKAYRKALLLGLVSLVMVSPILIYNLTKFSPTSAVTFNQMQSVLVNFAIPIHALAAVWLDNLEFLQVTLVVISLYMIRESKLFPVLLVSFLATVTLSVIQIWTGNKTLALLFPWRMSVFLVPLATTVIFAGFISLVSKGFSLKFPLQWFVQKPVRFGTALAGIIILFISLFSERILTESQSGFGFIQSFGALFGLALIVFSLAIPHRARIVSFFSKPGVKRLFQYTPIMLSLIVLLYLGLTYTISTLNSSMVGVNASIQFVQSNYHPGDIYLIPTDLVNFRIAAGVPVFVEIKSVPYKDTEVLEWYDRIKIANKFYSLGGEEACSILQDISNGYGITHVVTETTVDCQLLGEEYRDANYIIYKIYK